MMLVRSALIVGVFVTFIGSGFIGTGSIDTGFMDFATRADAAEPRTSAQDDAVIAQGSRLELYVDGHLVAATDGVDLTMHHPRHEGTVLEFDRPWEGAFCGYVTVMRDEDRLRMYYRGLPISGSDGSPNEVTCYAESQDGIHWTRPSLGIHEVEGTTDNNVILKDQAPATHNFCAFRDECPGVPESERYKGLGGTVHSGLIGYISADGLHWSRLADEAVFEDQGWVFDSQNVAFWSDAEQCYVLYYRKSPERFRAIARSTSADFREWSEPVMMDQGDVPKEHLYTNQTAPYFRAPHIYVAVCARFMPGRQVLSDAQAREIDVDPKYFGDISDAVLMTTRGGYHYDRTFLESFIRPGIGLENWVSRTNYPAWGIVQTGPTEMSVYVQKNYGQPTARLDRYAMRLDGFVSLHAGYEPGSVTTHTLSFTGDADEVELSLNFSSSAAGYVKVELRDADDQPIPGFTLADADELIGDDIERTVTWQGSSDVSALAAKPVKLHLEIKDADVYAFQFH